VKLDQEGSMAGEDIEIEKKKKRKNTERQDIEEIIGQNHQRDQEGKSKEEGAWW